MKSFKQTYENKTVLITGHTGFKGSWLSLWMSYLGAKVIGVSLDIPSQPSHFSAAKLSSDLIKFFKRPKGVELSSNFSCVLVDSIAMHPVKIAWSFFF